MCIFNEFNQKPVKMSCFEWLPTEMTQIVTFQPRHWFQHYFWFLSKFFRTGDDVWEIWQQKWNTIYNYNRRHCYKSVAMEVLRNLKNCQFTKVSAIYSFKKQFLSVKYVINSCLSPQPQKILNAGCFYIGTYIFTLVPSPSADSKSVLSIHAVSVYKNQSYKNRRWIFGKI